MPLCECEANKISFSSCLQQPVIHLNTDCLDAVSCSQSPSWPSGHARLLPGLLVTPDSSLAFQSSQASPQPSGHARLLPGLPVKPGSSLAFWLRWSSNGYCRVWKVLVMHVPKLLPDCTVKEGTIVGTLCKVTLTLQVTS